MRKKRLVGLFVIKITVDFFRLKKFRLTCDPAAELLMNVLLGCAIQNVETCLQYKQTNKQILLQLLVLQRYV